MALPINPTDGKLRSEILHLPRLVAAKGSFTLAANGAATVVFHPEVSINSVVVLQPASADAGVEAASGALWIECGTRNFTVHHSNLNNTTRTFKFAVTS